MVKVLTSWDDLGEAIEKLQQDQCFHADPLKNWDLSQIGELLDPMPRASRILDAGCSESQCSVLKYLRKKGFYNLTGMDLYINIDDRFQQLLPMVKERKLKTPFRLFKGNITKTKFADDSYDAIVCLSVIEHGVEIKAFMEEMNRLLKPGGILYVSTDYWPDKVITEDKAPWGLKWTVFSREEIFDIIRAARDAGMAIRDCEIPTVGKPIVKWSGREYTFLSMVLRKM